MMGRVASSIIWEMPVYSAIYAFGDSLTDDGNVSLTTAGLVPVSPPYANGSFTNGPVWVQDLAQDIGLPAVKPSLAGGTDFAYGGAQTGQTPAHTANPTDLPSQYSQFLAQISSPQVGALYAIWIGANDTLDIANNTTLTPTQQQADVAAAVSNEISVIRGLVARGAQNLLVLNVPDLGKTPYEAARGSAVAQTATSLASLYDSDLAASLQPLEASGALRVDLVDTFSVLNQVAANPGAYGFTNVTDPVWTGNLTSSSSGTLRASGDAQNQFLFFDSLHPTAQAHALLASGIAHGLLLPTPGLAVLDTTTGQPIPATAQPYAGPVAGLQEEYIDITTDNLNISVSTPNWFIHSGSGTDAIAVNSGTNVLDGGTGSNFLTGGSGTDTFFVDDRGPAADIWSTVVGFHAGDAATIWGVTPQDFDLAWVDGQGAAGFTGLTLHATASGMPTASLTLAGYTQADMVSGRLSVLFGTDPASGSAYMYVHGNS
jgi:phospholipase/lecithinase/hemolysin